MYYKYKIGEISKLTGIPVQTLRFYEQQGIITPQKKTESNYRYYDAWDLNFLLDCKYFRSLDFSLSDSIQLINDDNLETIKEKLISQQNEILNKISHYHEIMEMLSFQIENTNKIKTHLGNFKECNNPALIFQPHRIRETFCIDNSNQSSNPIPKLENWLNLAPLIVPSFRIHFDENNSSIENSEYWWGWSLTPEQAARHQIKINPPTIYTPSKRSVYTVFTAYGKGTFLKEFDKQVLKPLKNDGVEVTGFPIGRLLMRTHEGNRFVRYFETWIPV